MSKEIKLKPCPFCGGKAKLRKNEFFRVADWWYVACDNPHCGAYVETVVRPTQQDVVEIWNARCEKGE